LIIECDRRKRTMREWHGRERHASHYCTPIEKQIEVTEARR